MGIFDFFDSKKKKCRCGKTIDNEDNYCDSCLKEVIKTLKSKTKAKSDLEDEHVERNWKFDISPEQHDCKRLHPNHTHEEWQKIPDVSATLNPKTQLGEIMKDINKQAWNKRMPSDKSAITNPISKEKLPEWFNNKYKKAPKGDEVSNRFSGKIYKLTADELSMYKVLGSLNYLIETGKANDSVIKDFENGIDWFSRNNKEAYRGLCGVNQQVDLPNGYNMIGLDVVYDGNLALGNIREKFPLNHPLLFVDSKDGLNYITIHTENKNKGINIIDEIKQKTSDFSGYDFKKIDTNNTEEWDYLFNYRDLFYIGYVISNSEVRINMLRTFNHVDDIKDEVIDEEIFDENIIVKAEETKVEIKKNQPTNIDTLADNLTKLAELKEKGLLTEEEFNEQKKKLLKQ